MICRYRDDEGKCLNAEENILCKPYPSERYCKILCNFREPIEEETEDETSMPKL